MPLPSSGPISLNDVNVELGLAGTTSISMNSNIVRVLFAVPTDASSISMSNGYGKANVLTLNVPSQNNLNLRTFAVANGGSAYTKFVFNITGNIGSTSTAAALNTGTGWPAGTTITINIPNGVYVVGKGGDASASDGGSFGGRYASSGGDAISASLNITIVNNGVIGGGGGGGGGVVLQGGCTAFGGGGAGLVAGTRTGIGGSNGSLTTGSTSVGGFYCYAYYNWSGSGGRGGNLGEDGVDGSLSVDGYGQGEGANTRGLAGRAIVKNGNTVTTSGSGSILGAVVA